MTSVTAGEPALPDWARRIPEWVQPAEIRWLAQRPWIVGLIEPEDRSLAAACQRFLRSQRMMAHLVGKNQGSEIVLTRGLETTSLRWADSGRGVTRHVTLHATDAARIRGLAIPYAQPAPVKIRGIICYEQFDRDSFERLPASVPLRIQHDAKRAPLGTVTSLRHTDPGLAIEADIDPSQRREWAPRWVRGEYSSLSIAFAGLPIFDDWTQLADVPLRTVRRAIPVEVSVVRDPAYPSARITDVDGERWAAA